MKDQLIVLRHKLQEVVNNHPFDATEREIGYTAAMRHSVKLIDDILNISNYKLIDIDYFAPGENFIKIIKKETYYLILSNNPCELFKFFGVEELHGLTYSDCKKHINNTSQSYIAGLANYIPKSTNSYFEGRFIFINTDRCTDPISTMGLVMHEMMHHSMWLHSDKIDKEEEIITWAEEESYNVVDIITKLKSRQ